MTTSGYTSTREIIYVTESYGGVGLIGIPATSPSLQANIQGEELGPHGDLGGIIIATHSGSASIGGFIRPTFTGSADLGASIQVDSTGYNPRLYTSFGFGGFGRIDGNPTPDLLGVIEGLKAPGIGSLGGLIHGFAVGELSISGFIRGALPGTGTLGGTLSGVTLADLSGIVIPTFSGQADLNGLIEPIPPVSLTGIIEGFTYEDLSGLITPIEAVLLSGTISGQPYSNLLGSIDGYDQFDLSAVYSGFTSSRFSGIITGVGSGSQTLGATLHSVLGQNVSGDLSGFIRAAYPGSGNLSGTISGNWHADLRGYIIPSLEASGQLSGSISSNVDNVLIGNITSTGGYADLGGLIIPVKATSGMLPASISGHMQTDLTAIINDSIGSNLGASITASGPRYLGDLSGQIRGVVLETLSGSYDIAISEPLSGNILPIPGADLGATIIPRVFYIDSYLPINTYYVENLRGSINPIHCGRASAYEDFSAIIHGTNGADITCSYIGVAGQWAFTENELKILGKNSVITEDWYFVILDQPKVTETLLPIIITNSPLADLSASIEGVPHSHDLQGSITSHLTITKVSSSTVTPVGEWINTKTGQRKTIRIYFRGSLDDFYYSTTGNVTLPEGESFLDIIVETFDKLEEGSGILSVKTGTRTATVSISDFDSVDEAIRHAIVRSAGNLGSDLSAEIIGLGDAADLSAEIEGDDVYFEDVTGSYVAVGNQPVISGSITATGGYLDIHAQISGKIPALTASPFIDTNGLRYMPTLQITNTGDYAVILTQVSLSGTIPVPTPDLYSTISGVVVEDLGAQITGS